MTIRSNPGSALAYVDNQPVGMTPVSLPFVFYGTREIRLVKDGHETVVEKHNFRPPWYQYPPFDFITETLWPFEIRDERELQFALQPQVVVPAEDVLRRGEGLRGQSQQGIILQ